MNLLLSFSGGKTSAYMTKWMIENKKHEYDDIKILFANTGQENEKTLEFVDRCDKEWNLGVIWIEADINPEFGKGTSAKIVTFETASRNGDPFESMCKKYGIPNPASPFCTRELKLQPITSYLRSIGWKKGNYHTAIGIRFDEMDRVSAKMNENLIIYPLIEYKKVTKEMISIWWDKQPFNLGLREHEGNCKWCWKKSKRKLLTLAKETPDIFEFPLRMEKLYGRNGNHTDDESRKFFRNRQSTTDILEESKQPFIPFVEKSINFSLFDAEMDAPGGCSESCEVY
jgi:hypothetical protein